MEHKEKINIMDNTKLGLTTPWNFLYKEFEALFKDDPEVTINYTFNEDEYVIKLHVDNIEKADALLVLMPKEKVFGNVTVKIEVIPANKRKSLIETFNAAFKGNPAVNQCVTVKDYTGSDIGYVCFKNKVVQFFTDNLQDINGNHSTLYETIAKDIFHDRLGVFFCTDEEK